ncbi:hypothetical protein [Klebsiella grimontii]|uniref:hypothetical protein n=1 Tax=Klebsiella grimontii TaxID=2058152 RepID=UPI0012B83221|nr:hypothetical protein [Klebsiella grimontii]
MLGSEGFIIHFDEDERNYYINEGYYGDSFTDALSVPDWDIKKLQVVLLSFTGVTIDFICLATKGNRVVTAKSRVEFTNLIDLNGIPLTEVEERLSSKTKLHFIRSSTGRGGKVPKKTWSDVIKVLKNIRPDLSGEIDRLMSLKTISQYRLTGDSAETLALEREALGAALDIFNGNNDLRKEILKSWAPKLDDVSNYNDLTMEANLSIPENRPFSFISGIPQRHIQEESALQHDLYNWENEKAHSTSMGGACFRKGNRILEVVYANKNSLEHTLGVDLIYYNKSYQSFVLVQYKTMKEENDSDGFFYRPDKQLDKEIARMNDFHHKITLSKDFLSHHEYRLNQDGFLFKLVPCKGLQAASEKLISGMYITREYMQFLLGPNGPKGKRGGRFISFKNSPRYLTNTEFSDFVNRGWIGTNCKQSSTIALLIHGFLQTGRAVIVAVEEDTDSM